MVRLKDILIGPKNLDPRILVKDAWLANGRLPRAVEFWPQFPCRSHNPSKHGDSHMSLKIFVPLARGLANHSPKYFLHFLFFLHSFHR